MADIKDHLELREVENADGTDADVHVYFLGVHVETIKNTWTQPGSRIYVAKEECERKAQRLIKRLWVAEVVR